MKILKRSKKKLLKILKELLKILKKLLKILKKLLKILKKSKKKLLKLKSVIHLRKGDIHLRKAQNMRKKTMKKRNFVHLLERGDAIIRLLLILERGGMNLQGRGLIMAIDDQSNLGRGLITAIDNQSNLGKGELTEDCTTHSLITGGRQRIIFVLTSMLSQGDEERPLEDTVFTNLDNKLSYLHYLAFEENTFQ